MKSDFRVFPAPAKINRFLHITSRRKDGYHELQTVFQFLDLCDYLAVELIDSEEVELLTRSPLGPQEENLCIRAVRLLEKVSGKRFGLRLHLEKNIPVGGGLGGGSSDAATTLIVVNDLCALQFSHAELMKLAAQLGADVPVFVAGYAAWAEGIGDRLTPVFPKTPIALLVDPSIEVSTVRLYASPTLTRDCEALKIDVENFSHLNNVFEPLVRQQYPEVEKIFLEFKEMGLNARLSGSGGCVFSLFDSVEAANAVADQMGGSWQRWVVPVLNRSPLLAALDATGSLSSA